MSSVEQARKLPHQAESFNGVPSEKYLRQVITQRLAAVSPKNSHQIQQLIEAFDPQLDANNWRTVLENVVTNAKQASFWEAHISGEKNVQIGYYSSEFVFFTMFLHEAGHRVLALLGRGADQYQNDIDGEERFCWTFSRKVCTALDLEHNNDLAIVYFRMWRIVQRMSMLGVADCNRIVSNFEKLLSQQEMIAGASAVDLTTWTHDGLPLRPQ
jgi:hypothetical protein